jgi:cell division septum initiation protein DivIVA
MVKKQGTQKMKKVNLKVGNLSNISGEVNIAGGDITTNRTTLGLSTTEVAQLFNQIYSAIESHSGTSATTKEDLKAEVKEIQSTVATAVSKKERIDESFLARRFRNITRMAPEILDVVVATLANPLAGLGVAVAKIAEKAKSEAGQS